MSESAKQEAAAGEPTVKFEFSIPAANYILRVLQDRPMVEVRQLVEDMERQAREQMPA